VKHPRHSFCSHFSKKFQSRYHGNTHEAIFFCYGIWYFWYTVWQKLGLNWNTISIILAWSVKKEVFLQFNVVCLALLIEHAKHFVHLKSLPGGYSHGQMITPQYWIQR